MPAPLAKGELRAELSTYASLLPCSTCHGGHDSTAAPPHGLCFPPVSSSPANLLAGTGPRSASPSRAPAAPPHGPNNLLTSGLIIAASVIVAAGIAIYESPQVRQWADQTRRKIAIALHNLGDDIQPRRPSESSDDFDERKRRRDDLVRRNRNELIRRAREEGVAVDLDELAKMGTETTEAAERRSRADRTKSFDDMVSSDGTLKANTTATEPSNGDVRKRGAAGFAAGSAAAAVLANPFDDDATLLDHDNHDDAPAPKPFVSEETATRESSATVEAQAVSTPTAAPLVDLTPATEPAVPQLSLPEASFSSAQAQADETEQAAQSFYSFTSADSHPAVPQADSAPVSHPFFSADADTAEHVSTGTLTPRSERSMTMASVSEVSHHADDIAVLSMQNDTDHDARSEIFSEGGFTDAFSESGFSEFETGSRAGGVMTPSSWSHVGSDDEREWGGAAGGNGDVSQVHQ